MQWITGYQNWLSENESLHNAQIVADHFAGSWTPEAIAALCGNMRHESSINPDMYEYGYTWEQDRGYGLVQWTPRSKYWDWAVSSGYDPRDGNSQLARIDYEQANAIQWISTSSYPLSFNEFTKSNADVGYLTQAFTWNYERPNRQAGEESMPARIAFARRVLNEIDFSGNGSGTIHFIFPTDQPVSSGFRTPERPDHNGVDFAGSGTHEIVASASGTVSRSYVSSSYGETIMILHYIEGQEYETVYAHLREGSRLYNEGDQVNQGDILGIMGNTGDSRGQHLHFEIHRGRWNDAKSNAIDPMSMLGKPSGGGSDPQSASKNIFHLWLSGALPWGG